MSYRIGEVHYKNFGPFKDVTVDLGVPGLTVILGTIEGKMGCDSNGSGKSMLFDGVAWALYGRCIRGSYTGDEIIRTEMEDGENVPVTGGTRVEIKFADGDQKLRVVRYRKDSRFDNKLHLFVNGTNVSRGTDGETELAIEHEIGMDFGTFCNSIAFGARDDVKSFFTATDADRKKLLDRMLGLELYADAEKIARARVRELAEKLTDYNEDRIELQTQHAEKTVSLERIADDATLDDLEFTLKLRRARYKILTTRIEQLRSECDAVKKKITEAEKAFSGVMREYQIKEREYLAETSKISDTITKYKRSINELAGQQHSVRLRMTKFEKLQGTTCPECEQPVAKAHGAKLMEAMQSELEEFESKADVKKLKLKAAEDKYELLEMPEMPECEEARVLGDEVQQINGRVAEVTALRREENIRIEELHERVERVSGTASTVKKELHQVSVKLQKVDEERAKLSDEQAIAAFWSEAFGTKGLRSFLIEAALPEINRYAAQFAQRLLGPGAFVRLSATTRLKRKDAIREKLNVEGFIPGCTNSYVGASKGQRKRMDLSLLLAFRQLVASRTSKAFDQLFVDEVFDGLDQTGAESVSELLGELSGGCPVALITHDQRLRPDSGRVLTVRHNGQFAAVA